MPTYQYSCKECGHFFEVFQNFNDDSLTVCPECSGSLRKVFNAVGVVFKGSGFYRTDSRDQAAGKAAGGNGTKHAAATGGESTGDSSSGDSSSSSSESSGAKTTEASPAKAPAKSSSSGTSSPTD